MIKTYEGGINFFDNAEATLPVNQKLDRERPSPEQVRHFFFEVAAQIAHRIDLFCSLPDPKLDALEVQLIGEKFR